MAWKQWITDRLHRWMQPWITKSPIVPLSTKEIRLLAALNDIFNTLIGYIVVMSILLDISHRYTHQFWIQVFFYILIFLVITIFFLKITIQLLATGVAVNRYIYALAIVAILLTLIFTIGILTI